MSGNPFVAVGFYGSNQGDPILTEPRAWKFRPDIDGNVIDHMLSRCAIGLDYRTPGLHPGMTREQLISAVRRHNPDRSDKGIHAHAGQLDTLLNRVAKGDLALVPRTRGRFMMIGVITSDQAFVSKTIVQVSVRWLAPDVPLSSFDQDLQYSFMAIHKFCEVSRNDAPTRLMKICQGEADPGF